MVTEPPQLALLQDARARKVPWLEVADALLALEAQSLGGAEGRPWIQIASDLSGYTTNQLRRMTRVVQTVRRLVQERHLKDAGVLTTLRFSHLEMAVRIYSFEPETALKVLRDELDRPTYPQLVGTYQRLRDNAPATYAPMVAGKRAARRFQDLALGLLPRFLDLGTDQRMGRMTHPSKYANPDFVVVTRHHGRIAQVDGIDCYALSGPSQRDQVMRRVMQVAVESTFFTSFWVTLPDESHARTFHREARMLHLWNVGVIAVDLGKATIVEHWRPTGRPELDRTALWLEHLPLQLP